MTQDTAINSIMRDMRIAKIVTDENNNLIQQFIEQAWVAGWEYYRRTEINHNKKKVNYFDANGNLLHTFNSIEETARELGMGRSAVDDILYGKSKGRRNTGNYFEYAKNGND